MSVTCLSLIENGVASLSDKGTYLIDILCHNTNASKSSCLISPAHKSSSGVISFTENSEFYNDLPFLTMISYPQGHNVAMGVYVCAGVIYIVCVCVYRDFIYIYSVCRVIYMYIVYVYRDVCIHSVCKGNI